MTRILVSKEKRNPKSWPPRDELKELSEEKRRKMKIFAHGYIKKLLQRKRQGSEGADSTEGTDAMDASFADTTMDASLADVSMDIGDTTVADVFDESEDEGTEATT